MKFVIDDKIPYISGALEKFGTVLYRPGKEITADDVRDANALIVRTRTKVNKALLEGSSVKFVATATIGFDHIDRDYLKEAGIQWTSCPGCNSESVAQYISAALIELSDKHAFELAGKTMGIVGVGNVGKKIAIKAKAFGMKVLLNDPPRAAAEGSAGFCDIDQLVAEADFITLHTPLNRDGEYKTFHLADEAFLKAMKPSAFIMNTCRGEIICNGSLQQALEKKEIAGAVIDVWENEPGINLDLVKLVDLVTSHIAGYSADGKATGTSMSVQALSRFFDFGMDDWFPENVPMPEKNLTTELSGMAAVKDVIRQTYAMHVDDKALRETPEKFEYNRGHYMLRREFHNYSVKVADKAAAEIIENLGFELLS